MTFQQAIDIKKMVESAYGQKTSDELSDTMWAAMLSEELYVVAKKALEKHMAKGSPFAPKLPELKALCNNVSFSLSDIKSEVIQYAIVDGYLGRHISAKDYQRTIDKIVIWEAQGRIPTFMKEDMRFYAQKFKQEKLSFNSNSKMLTQ